MANKAKPAENCTVTNRSGAPLDLILVGNPVEGVPPTKRVEPGETVSDAFDKAHFLFVTLAQGGSIEVAN